MSLAEPGRGTTKLLVVAVGFNSSLARDTRSFRVSGFGRTLSSHSKNATACRGSFCASQTRSPVKTCLAFSCTKSLRTHLKVF